MVTEPDQLDPRARRERHDRLGQASRSPRARTGSSRWARTTGKPAVWTTANGRSWKTIVLPVPNQEQGPRAPCSSRSRSTATAWSPSAGHARGWHRGQYYWSKYYRGWHRAVRRALGRRRRGLAADAVQLAGPDTTFTALTAASSVGFTAAGLFGLPGQQTVAVWTSATSVSWKPSQSSGLNGSEAWQIDALAPSGSAVTGIGTIITQQSQQTVTFTLPSRSLRKFPCASPA